MPFQFKMTYEVVTPESAEQGDCEERGWHIEEGQSGEFETLEELFSDLRVRDKSWLEWSGSHPTQSHDWLTSSEEENFKTGANTSYCLWVWKTENGARVPLSDEEWECLKDQAHHKPSIA